MKDSTRKMQKSVPAEKIFVEVLGADGLLHHVGPFSSHEQAEDWIAQNSPDKVVPPEQNKQKLAAVNATNPRSRPSE